MRIMTATHADTCINAFKNIRDLPSGSTSEINMGGTQVTYLLDSSSYGSARANLTDAFYKRNKANFEHAVWLHPRKVIFIAQSILYILLKNFYPIVI